MAVLLDTNIICRLANADDTAHSIAACAIAALHRQNEGLNLTAQNFVEFRNYATRPKSANGLGVSSAEAEAFAAAFENSLRLLPELPTIFTSWKEIVSKGSVIGKQVHDARLVAVCQAHQIENLLTSGISRGWQHWFHA